MCLTDRRPQRSRLAQMHLPNRRTPLQIRQRPSHLQHPIKHPSRQVQPRRHHLHELRAVLIQKDRLPNLPRRHFRVDPVLFQPLMLALTRRTDPLPNRGRGFARTRVNQLIGFSRGTSMCKSNSNRISLFFINGV
jgi:hypothetical protein